MTKSLVIIPKQNAQLLNYDSACRALAEAHRIDEVKDIHDKAAAFQEYARISKNYDLEKQAYEIRMRAERRAGQLLRNMKKNKGGGSNQHRSRTGTGAPKLSEIGITKKESSNWQNTANLSEPEFEQKIVNFKAPKPKQPIKESIKPHYNPSRAKDLWDLLMALEMVPPEEIVKLIARNSDRDIANIKIAVLRACCCRK